MTQKKPFEIKRIFNGDMTNYIFDANAEIERLQQELDEKEPAWTPITSVEQVEGLEDGFYLLEARLKDDALQAVHSHGVWRKSTLLSRKATRQMKYLRFTVAVG